MYTARGRYGGSKSLDNLLSGVVVVTLLLFRVESVKSGHAVSAYFRCQRRLFGHDGSRLGGTGIVISISRSRTQSNNVDGDYVAPKTELK